MRVKCRIGSIHGYVCFFMYIIQYFTLNYLDCVEVMTVHLLGIKLRIKSIIRVAHGPTNNILLSNDSLY